MQHVGGESEANDRRVQYQQTRQLSFVVVSIDQWQRLPLKMTQRILTPWGHAPRVLVVGSQRCYFTSESAEQPRRPLEDRLPQHQASKGRFSRDRNTHPQTSERLMLANRRQLLFCFRKSEGAKCSIRRRKSGPGLHTPRKTLPHHVNLSKSARISHHEPTAQRLLPMIWRVATSRGLASGMESRGLTAACSISDAASRHVDSPVAELCFKCRHA